MEKQSRFGRFEKSIYASAVRLQDRALRTYRHWTERELRRELWALKQIRGGLVTEAGLQDNAQQIQAIERALAKWWGQR